VYNTSAFRYGRGTDDWLAGDFIMVISRHGEGSVRRDVYKGKNV
jgi:hypothetical protein